MIVATIDRVDELCRFLDSVNEQDVDKSTFEVVVVDQNDDGRIDGLITGYNNCFSVKHIKIKHKGTSIARNHGIRLATGHYVSFPDDDCILYPDFIKNLQSVVHTHASPEVVIARIYDRKSNRSLIKPFPDSERCVYPRHFYLYGSAIVIITRLRIFFDEDFGPGARYFSNEDPEYLLRLVNATSNGYGFYSPDLQVWHEESVTSSVTPLRASRYGIGLGAVFRKHLSPSRIIIFLMLVTYSLIKGIISSCCFKKGSLRYLVSTVSRIYGFVIYRHR